MFLIFDSISLLTHYWPVQISLFSLGRLNVSKNLSILLGYPVSCYVSIYINQPRILTGGTDAQVEAPILWSPDGKS